MSRITIRKNVDGEFEVPAPTKAELYFTDDKDDAIGTARMIHGDDVECVFRSGTYQKGE